MHPRQNTKQSTTGIFFNHGAYWIRLLHLDTCTGGFQYLLVITGYFTRYTQVYLTRFKEAKTATTKLFNDYILRFATPGQILHDQARGLEKKKLFTYLSKLCNIKGFVQHLITPSVIAKLRE